jgi:hypothetical protein
MTHGAVIAREVAIEELDIERAESSLLVTPWSYDRVERKRGRG